MIALEDVGRLVLGVSAAAGVLAALLASWLERRRGAKLLAATQALCTSRTRGLKRRVASLVGQLGFAVREHTVGEWADAGAGHSLHVQLKGFGTWGAETREALAEAMADQVRAQVLAGRAAWRRVLPAHHRPGERPGAQGDTSHYLRLRPMVEVEVDGAGAVRAVRLDRSDLVAYLVAFATSRPGAPKVLFASQGYGATEQLRDLVRRLANGAAADLAGDGVPGEVLPPTGRSLVRRGDSPPAPPQAAEISTTTRFYEACWPEPGRARALLKGVEPL